jgi:MFS family permease
MARITSAPAEAVVDSRPMHTGVFAAWHTPSFPALWFSGLLWNVARWISLFTGSYLVYHQSGSTLLVQLVGTAFFAPMFLGGLAGGVIADRMDRRLVLVAQIWIVVAVSAVIGFDCLSGKAEPWHIYPAMALLGCGAVADMTCRRALIADVVGPSLLANAFALESVSMTAGSLAGNLLGGAVIDLAGSGQAFLGAGILCAVAALLLTPVRLDTRREHRLVASVRRQLVDGLCYATRNRALIGVLGVTVVMNVFFYTYMPLVPVFAKRLDVNAFWTGALGGAAGLGALVGAFVIASADRPHRRVAFYCGGTLIALAGLVCFAFANAYALALAALTVAGAGTAGFSTMQSTLVMQTTTAEMRGRAMGALSMAIGTLPIALFVLGAIAEATGPVSALGTSALIGIVALAVCWTKSPALRAAR